MAINHAGKADPISQETSALTQKVFILCHENTAQRCRAQEQNLVVCPVRPVLLRRKHVDTAQAQRSRYGSRHVDVHVESDAHGLPFEIFVFQVDEPLPQRRVRHASG